MSGCTWTDENHRWAETDGSQRCFTGVVPGWGRGDAAHAGDAEASHLATELLTSKLIGQVYTLSLQKKYSKSQNKWFTEGASATWCSALIIWTKTSWHWTEHSSRPELILRISESSHFTKKKYEWTRKCLIIHLVFIRLLNISPDLFGLTSKTGVCSLFGASLGKNTIITFQNIVI